MSWSVTYYYALKGERKTLEKIKAFFEGFPENEDGTGVHLHDVRKALYGDRFSENPRMICAGPGYVSHPVFSEDGLLEFSVEAFKNMFESLRFLRTLRKRIGKFRYDVLIDYSEICSGFLWTTDRTGKVFPHFTLIEGTPEDLECFPYVSSPSDTVKMTDVATSSDLMREFRRIGFDFHSFRDFVARCPDLLARDAEGKPVAGVWGVSSPVLDLQKIVK